MYSQAYKIRTLNGNTRDTNYKFIPAPPWEGIIPNYFKSRGLGEAPVCTIVVGIPKKIFLEAGGFPQAYPVGEDEDLWTKIGLKYPVAFNWETGAIYNTDATNRATHRNMPLGYVEPAANTIREALRKGEVLPEFVEPLNECVYEKDIRRAMEYVLAGDGKTARAILRDCKTKWYYKKKLKCFALAMLPYKLLLTLQNLKRKVSLS